ncbi:MAG: class I SAM-dependent methyltransferase, partial [Verrucomicrobiota bacterium]
GNHRILGRYAAAFSWKSAVELGAGDGELLRRLASRFPDRHLRGIDFAPQPSQLPKNVSWLREDILESDFSSTDVLVANLILHHFTNEQLKALAPRLRDCSAIFTVEPFRDRRAMFLSRGMGPFVNEVTRHDMKASIEAGFRPGELPELLGLNSETWRVEERTTFRGALVLAAWKR